MAALGITYAPMVCIDRCTPNPNGGATSLIAVDGDGTNWSSTIVVRCLNGETCILDLANANAVQTEIEIYHSH